MSCIGTVLMVSAVDSTLATVSTVTNSSANVGAVTFTGTVIFLSAVFGAMASDGAMVSAVDHWSNDLCTISFFGAVLEEDPFSLSLDSAPGCFKSLDARTRIVPEEPVASLVLGEGAVDSLLSKHLFFGVVVVGDVEALLLRVCFFPEGGLSGLRSERV